MGCNHYFGPEFGGFVFTFLGGSGAAAFFTLAGISFLLHLFTKSNAAAFIRFFLSVAVGFSLVALIFFSLTIAELSRTFWCSFDKNEGAVLMAALVGVIGFSILSYRLYFSSILRKFV